MSDVVTVGGEVEMTISQDDLCKAVQHWLKDKLGIGPDLTVLQVRTKAHQAREAELSFTWMEQEGAAMITLDSDAPAMRTKALEVADDRTNHLDE